jgi:hypothetical protein
LEGEDSRGGGISGWKIAGMSCGVAALAGVLVLFAFSVVAVIALVTLGIQLDRTFDQIEHEVGR